MDDIAPTSDSSPVTRHRLARQMQDASITLPDAIDLATHKAMQLEQYFVTVKGIDAPEMRNLVARLREAAFWTNEFNRCLQQLAEDEAKPKIVIAQDMPPLVQQ
jgi:hypothetical protein